MSSKDQALNRKRAYQRLFEGEDAQIVLDDLKRFCRANIPTFTEDDPNGRVSAFKEGRRDVWLRIDKWMTLTDAELDKMD